MKTLKALAIFCLSAMLVSCAVPETSDGGNTGSGDGNTINEKGVSLVVDKLFIYNNGGVDEEGNEDKSGIATFTVYYNGEDVTEMATIYVVKTIEGTNVTMDEPIVGNTYTSTAEPCSISFWAAYGTEDTEDRDIVLNIVQTPPAAPEVPTDNDASKTNFTRRVLITQFTGTGCGFCPEMVNALHTIANNAYYQKKFVLAAAHLYNNTDPAYLKDAKTLDKVLGVKSYPTINVDMWKNNTNRNANDVGDLIDDALTRTTVKGGIAVNAKYYETEKYVTVSCLVKAKEAGEFRVGAWLLEDKVYGSQANNGYSAVTGVDFNYHNNCIRIANQSRQTSSDYTGMELLSIESAGGTKSCEFAFPLLNQGWKAENLRLVVFISTKEGNKWYVNNVITAPINGSVDFEYEN